MKNVLKQTILTTFSYFLIVVFLLEKDKSIVSNIITAITAGIFIFIFSAIFYKNRK